MHYLEVVPSSGNVYAFRFDISVIAMHDARVVFGFASLGNVFFLRSLYSKFFACQYNKLT